MDHFKSPVFLREQVRQNLDFYLEHGQDPSGGFYQSIDEDGSLIDSQERHLLSSCGLCASFALAYLHGQNPLDLQAAQHGYQFLRIAHRGGDEQLAWSLSWNSPQQSAQWLDSRARSEGLAAYLHCASLMHRLGQTDANQDMAWAFAQLEQLFWEADAGLYADECDSDGKLLPYRSQHSNLRICEALLAAYAADPQAIYMDRCAMVAGNVVVRLAGQNCGLIWPHYQANWLTDPDYNRDGRADPRRPWGFSVGALTAWANILLQLTRHNPEPWHQPRAAALFDAAMHHGWDFDHGGLHCTFASDASIHDPDKYAWVQAAALAASARLFDTTSRPDYWAWYQRIWNYCCQNLVDKENSGWAWVRGAQNQNIGGLRCVPGDSPLPILLALDSLFETFASTCKVE